MAKDSPKGWKTVLEKEKLLVTAISPFPTGFSKYFYHIHLKTRTCLAGDEAMVSSIFYFSQNDFKKLSSSFKLGIELRRVDQKLLSIIHKHNYGIFLKYRALAAEQGKPIPESPIVFLKPVSSYIEEGQPIKVNRF